MTTADPPEYILPECSFAESLDIKMFEDSKCTPQFVDPFTKFKGIVINGPREVVWPKGTEPQEASPFGRTSGLARLMIAARFRLPESTLGYDGWFQNEILFVAVNQTTKETYSGKVPKFGKRPQRMSNRSGNDPNRISGGGVNADLVNIAGVPIAPATYTVYATLGEYKSNVLTIKTMVK